MNAAANSGDMVLVGSSSPPHAGGLCGFVMDLRGIEEDEPTRLT
jgi:hypothetical protein